MADSWNDIFNGQFKKKETDYERGISYIEKEALIKAIQEYYNNRKQKKYKEEIFKNTLLDTVECMEYAMAAEGEDYKEDNDNG